MPKPEAKPDDLLACGDAAKILECSADNVRRLTSSGHLAVAFTAANPQPADSPRPPGPRGGPPGEASPAPEDADPHRAPIPQGGAVVSGGGNWEFTGQAVPALPGWELVTLTDLTGRREDYTMNREAIHAWGVYARRGGGAGEFDLRPMTVRPMTAADQNGRFCALWYGPDHVANEVVVGVYQMSLHPPVADIDAAAETLRTRQGLVLQE